MDNLQLQPGEKILLQTTDAWRYQGDEEYEVDDLYLTNQHIICVSEESKGIFFTKTETHLTQIPLAEIEVVDGIPQVEQIKDKDHGKTLRIKYKSGRYDIFELCDSPRKNYPIWKAAISNAVVQILPKPISHNVPPPKFCAYCGVALQDEANFCIQCGLPVNRISNDSVAQRSGNGIVNEESKSFGADEHKSYTLRIKEKKYSLRKNYIISNVNGDILYVAKSEGLPKMPEIVIYKQDEEIGRIERTMFYKPLWGEPEYTLHWNGKKYVSLHRKPTLKRLYDIPEKGWEFHFGVMTSKVVDKTGSVVMDFGMIISSTKDRYSVEYYDEQYEPAAVLFALVDAMSVDLE